MSFVGEIKRRKVLQIAAVYAVVSWLLVQIAATVEAPLNLPDWFDTAVIVLLAIGFPITLIISWAFNVTPEGLVRDPGVGPQTKGRTIEYFLLGVLIVAVGWLVYRDFTPSGGLSTDDGGVLPNSVAILPLENLSPDPDNAYVAAGLHEEILNQLAKLSGLNVISRSSVLRFAENRLPIPEIGRMLNVEAVMEGSVRYAEDRIRVTMQLIDAATDQHVWSETYEREFEDIFAIESDIAMNVANALAAEFSDEDQQRIEKPPTDSPVAYALYLQAASSSQLPAEQRRELLDQAIAIDPNFAMAYGLRAALYAQRVIMGPTSTAQGSDRDIEQLVRESAAKALELDPNELNAFSALGHWASFTWRWTEAAEAYRRQVEIDPTVANFGSYFLTWSGNTSEALKLARRRAALNPLDPNGHIDYGQQLLYAGQYDAAAAELHAAIELNPLGAVPYYWLAFAEIARGDFEQAERELELTEQVLVPSLPIAVASLPARAYAYARIGGSENAQRMVDEMTRLAGQGYDFGAGGWAFASLAIGDEAQALAWLRRGIEKALRHETDAGYLMLMNMKLNVTNDPVLEQPEFVDARNRLRGD